MENILLNSMKYPHWLKVYSAIGHCRSSAAHERRINGVAEIEEFDLGQFVNFLQRKNAFLELDLFPVGAHLKNKDSRKTCTLDMGADGYYRIDALALVARCFSEGIGDVM